MIKNKLQIQLNGTDPIKNPNDRTERYMTAKGKEVVTKLDTKDLNDTHRQYMKKDGTLGRQTLTLKEVRP